MSHEPALTVQRNCASGMEAVAEAAMRIRSQGARAVLAGGAESMSTLPLLLPDETLVPMTRLAKARSVWQKASAVATLRPRQRDERRILGIRPAHGRQPSKPLHSR